MAGGVQSSFLLRTGGIVRGSATCRSVFCVHPRARAASTPGNSPRTIANASMTSPTTDDECGAFISRDRVPGAPAGPLHGLTFGVKDLFDVVGQQTGFGNPQWKASHPEATSTAPAVQLVLDAGATMVGRCHMDELAYSLNGENAHYGTPRNPATPERVPGGSSSGSAVVVGSGQVSFALGSDTAGSVRVPASYCGLYGMRPTHGRISLEAARPLAPSFDTVGWFARNAAVLRAVGRVLLESGDEEGGGAGTAPQPRRMLWCKDGFALADAAVVEALADKLRSRAPQLQQQVGLAWPVPEVDLATLPGRGNLQDWMKAFRVLQAREVWQCHGSWVQENNPQFGPGIRERFEMASRVTPEEEAAAAQAQKEIAAHIDSVLGTDGVLLLPTAPGPAPLLNTPSADLETFRMQALTLTSIAGLAGLPQVNLPVATVDGCPVGLSVVMPRGRDEAALALAELLAKALVP